MMERCVEMHKILYICFIDYTKAFDRVKHDMLINYYILALPTMFFFTSRPFSLYNQLAWAAQAKKS